MSGVSFAEPDITLHLDEQGVICGASVSKGIPGEDLEAWVGRPWLETVSRGSDTVTRMLADARDSGVSAFRDVVQRFPSGRELPIEYTTLRVAGERGGLLALGKNLQAMAELQSRLAAAQQATEREYWKLRDVETRYRLLFDASSEAVLMIGGEELRIVEANPAAVRALGLSPGWEFAGGLMPKEREAFLSMLARVQSQGRAPGIVLHLGPALAPWAVRASLMTSAPATSGSAANAPVANGLGSRYVLHIAPAGARPAQSAAEKLPLDELIERLPDGFVVIDLEGTILRANTAFLDLVQVGATGSVRGKSLGRWLSQPGADVSVLLASLQRYQTVRLFETILSGELGLEMPVEISAAGIGDGKLRFCGMLLRDISRREVAAPGGQVLPDRQQPDQGSLVEVVRAAAETVERRMIREALERSRGNRTAAAEQLGISRQSLHSKLNRYGMADEGDPPAVAAE